MGAWNSTGKQLADFRPYTCKRELSMVEPGMCEVILGSKFGQQKTGKETNRCLGQRGGCSVALFQQR